MFTIRISSAHIVNVILETDMTLDVDDVGALAVVHALADRNEARLLGVSFNEIHPDGVRAITAINAWYDRIETPIAQFTGTLQNPDESRYLSYLAKMLDESIHVEALDAMDFYEETLSSQQDQSVTIVSLGFLNNLADLLRKHPSLVKQKVRRLIAMGGKVNDNFNFVRHGLVDESQFVIARWPTQLVVTDFGGDLYTGVSLSSTSTNNPVREAYFRWFDGSIKGRSSWDQIAVLVGVRGEAGDFDFVGDLTGRLQNGFTWQFDGKHRAYARPTKSRDFYIKEIEALMSIEPRAY
ncbi:MAG: nucleoside hydrolase [Gammaproteobacteria bacterium]|nr:nucleoside hydrolase [Gammaproteobacteria bacterium]